MTGSLLGNTRPEEASLSRQGDSGCSDEERETYGAVSIAVAVFGRDRPATAGPTGLGRIRAARRGLVFLLIGVARWRTARGAGQGAAAEALPTCATASPTGYAPGEPHPYLQQVSVGVDRETFPPDFQDQDRGAARDGYGAGMTVVRDVAEGKKSRVRWNFHVLPSAETASFWRGTNGSGCGDWCGCDRAGRIS